MKQQNEVLSPWAERNPVPLVGINPRVTDLNKVTLGLIQNGKKAAVPILKAVERQLQAHFPELLSKGIYQNKNDDEKAVTLEDWLRDVDTIVLAVGD